MNMCKFTLRGECLVQIPSTDVATLNILLFLFIQNHYCEYSGEGSIGECGTEPSEE